MTDSIASRPDREVSVHETFGIDVDLMVPAFAERDDHVMETDPIYSSVS